MRRLIAGGIALGVLAGLVAIGRALAPSWDPQPVPPDQEYRPPPAASPELPAAGGFRREDAEVQVDGERLAAFVFSPERPGPHPGVVMVHGGGAGKRDAFVAEAEHLAGHGIAVLLYDKRTVGYTPMRRDYRQLGADAVAAAAVLRERPDVDPDNVGLWGTSEGGWTITAAAATDPTIAFLILMNTPATSPLQQSTWALDTGLRRIDVPEGAHDAAVRAFNLGGFDYVRYDPLSAQRSVRVPALLLHGTGDLAVPPVESARRLGDALGGGHTVRFFAGADHAMRVDGDLAPGYLQTMTSWILGLPELPQPEVAGATPTQEYLSATVATPWYGGAPAHAVAFGVIVAGYLAAPVAALVARLRRRRSGSGLGGAVVAGVASAVAVTGGQDRRRRLRWLVVAGVATVLTLNTSLATSIALALAGASSGTPATVAWYLARAVAALTVVLLVFTAADLLAGRRSTGIDRVRLYGVLAATAVAVLLAAYWLA